MEDGKIVKIKVTKIRNMLKSDLLEDGKIVKIKVTKIRNMLKSDLLEDGKISLTIFLTPRHPFSSVKIRPLGGWKDQSPTPKSYNNRAELKSDLLEDGKQVIFVKTGNTGHG